MVIMRYVGTLKGSDLVGKTYDPPFNYIAIREMLMSLLVRNL